MILRFHPDAGEAQRAAVLEALEDLEVEVREMDEILVLGRTLEEEEALRVASMEGVASLALADARTLSLREDLLRRVAGACLVLGLLVLIGSNFPPGLGPPADPGHTPAGLRPAWPMLAWYALEERAPERTPVGLLVLAAGALLLLWPLLGRRLAERRPGLHTALGVAALLAGAVLAFLGWTR